MTDWLTTSIPQLCLALRGDELPMSDYIALLERQMRAEEPQVRAFLDEPKRFERLQVEARALIESHPDRRRRPSLFGLGAGVKDIFHVDGFLTRAGSRLPPEVLAGPQAECVSQLVEAGGLVLGKTVTTEFAYFAPGATRNPRNLEHTPGGSSSGSAAAVAAGIAPLALGTQTIGSVIRPASFCGVVGFKPTFGRVSTHGVIPLSPSLDHVGWFARDVAGIMAAAGVLCRGWNPEAPDSRPRFGIPEGPYLARADESARRLLVAAVEALRRAGYEVKAVSVMRDFEAIARNHQTILAAEVARVHSAWFRDYANLYHTRTAELILAGQAIDDSTLREALGRQAALRQAITETMETEGVDLWISPAAVGAAPRGLESTGDPIMNLPWTQAGMPALTLPAAVDTQNLPIGIQLVARPDADERLLAWADPMQMILRESEGAAPRLKARSG